MRFEINDNEMERTLEVHLVRDDGTKIYVASTNYYDSSWSGMEILENTVRRIAQELNIPVIEVESEDEEENE